MIIALVAASTMTTVYAQPQEPHGQQSQVPKAKAKTDGQPEPATRAEHQPEAADSESATVPMPPTELDFPLDEKIKVKVEPFIPGSLVDRIVEPTTVQVECLGAAEINLFVVAVDSPYGGKALEKPRLIGKDAKPSDGFKIHWNNKEPDPYVKIFAVVRKKNGPKRFRSHTLDFAMAGARFEPKKAPQ